MNRQHRIGIDIDTKNQSELLRKYFNSRLISEDIETYETRGGYHFHIRMDSRTKEENLHIRRMIGDCKNRIELDEYRTIKYIDVMFFYKETKNRGKKIISREEPFNILSEPWFKITPSSTVVMS